MVHHYEYSTINSHHKVLVNLQASNMYAKLERCRLTQVVLYVSLLFIHCWCYVTVGSECIYSCFCLVI